MAQRFRRLPWSHFLCMNVTKCQTKLGMHSSPLCIKHTKLHFLFLHGAPSKLCHGVLSASTDFSVYVDFVYNASIRQYFFVEIDTEMVSSAAFCSGIVLHCSTKTCTHCTEEKGGSISKMEVHEKKSFFCHFHFQQQ